MSTDLMTIQHPNALAPIAGAVTGPAPSTYRAHGLFDPQRFEMTARVANIMADAALCPEALRGYRDGQGENAKFVAFPIEQTRANCFLVVDQAYGWNMSPFALAQCVSVVYGRLMFEGKVIAAAIEGNLGVRLSYEYDDKPGEKLGITVSGHYPGEAKPRTVSGTVEDWKTTGRNTPWVPRNFRRQLAYRGAREWARLHAPALVLGIVSDDESLEDDRRPGPAIEQDGAPRLLQTGFTTDSASEAPEASKPAPAPRAARKKAAPAAEAPPATEPEKEPDSSTEQQHEGETQQDSPAAEDEDAGEGSEDARTPGEAALLAYAEALQAASSWTNIAAALNALETARRAGATFTPEQGIAIRRRAWLRALELSDQNGEILKPEDDGQMFACYLQGTDDPDHIKTKWTTVQLGDEWRLTPAKVKDATRAAVHARVAHLEGVAP